MREVHNMTLLGRRIKQTDIRVANARLQIDLAVDKMTDVLDKIQEQVSKAREEVDEMRPDEDEEGNK